jgi:hypothetical protein
MSPTTSANLHAEPIGPQYESASAGPVSAGVVDRVITKSMTRHANNHRNQKLTHGKQRPLESDNVLPPIAEHEVISTKRKEVNISSRLLIHSRTM